MSTEGTALVAALADDLWQHYLSTQPYLQLRNGVEVEHLPVGSADEADRDAVLGEDLLVRCRQLDALSLPEGDRRTVSLVRDHAERLSRTKDLWPAQFPVTPYQLSSGLGLSISQALPSVSPGSDPERFTALVEDVATAVDVMGHKLGEMKARGWVLPQPAFPGVIATVTGLRGRLDQVLTGAAQTLARVERIRDDRVLPAFDRLLAQLDSADYRAAAPSHVGLGQYPGGPEAYLELARQSITFAVDPADVQQRGREQLEELSEHKREIRSGLGFPDEADFLDHLRESGRLHARTPEDVEKLYRRHIAAIEPLVGRWFEVTPKAPYGLERLDLALEAGMSYGYYEPPNDVNPVGRYRYNGSGLEERSQLNAAALIFHELIPGHHFHVAREAEDATLPMFRSQVPHYAAYTEGWAEYAASLADEMGLFDDPYDKYGHLVHQSFVCVRLVVDTGLNALGMTLGEAREVMRDHCFESEEQIATETLRYSTDWPGQALGYRMGYSEFWAARREAEAALGDQFDVTAFHETVLAPGSRPLPMVRDDVRQWIRESTAALEPSA